MYSCPSLATKTRRPLLNCVLMYPQLPQCWLQHRPLFGGQFGGQQGTPSLISTHRSKQKGRLQPAYSSTQLGQQSQNCASTSPTPFKSPSATAPHQVLKKMAPHPCRHLQLGHGQLWQEREVDPRLVWSYHCRTRASDSSHFWQHCSTTRGSLLHSGKPATMPNGSLTGSPGTTGWISVRASNYLLTAGISAPCTIAWR